MEPREILIYLALLYNGDYRKINDAIQTRCFRRNPVTDKIYENLNCKAVTSLDPDFPKCFDHTICQPFVLFYQGNLELLRDQERCITMIGSREANDYVLQETERLARELAEDGYVIVSGLARGVDAAAHRGAIKYGKTIAFLGNGIRRYYPADNAELQDEIGRSGLLISEYPPDVSPAMRHFPARNRLIAAAGKITLCMAATPQSGSLITVNFALHDGKEVGCLPERSTEHSECNQMIKEGAWMIESKEDILDMMTGCKKHPGEEKMFPIL